MIVEVAAFLPARKRQTIWVSPGYCHWVASCVFDKAERAGTLRVRLGQDGSGGSSIAARQP